MTEIRTVGISAKITSQNALDLAAQTAADLRARGLGVCFDFGTADKLNDRGPCSAKAELGIRTDLLITFGGDGTLLSLARHAPDDVPILGVNMGTLGFLTEVAVEDFPMMLDRVLTGDYTSERRVTFDVTVRGPQHDRTRKYRVLNDATINKSALARIVEMEVKVSGTLVSNFRADGLIVSTPTGSTAYNLAAGGPIVQPVVDAIVLTPIAPHMLTNRPIVIPASSIVRVQPMMNERDEIYVTFDGQAGYQLESGDEVRIRCAERRVRLLRPSSRSYFEVLRQKLKWNER